jgi:hypothetical protein
MNRNFGFSLLLTLLLLAVPLSAQISFTNVAPEMGLDIIADFGYVFPFDYDGDDDLDFLQLSRFGGSDLMFRNEGETFTLMHNIGLASSSDAWKVIPMDFDHDRDLDLLITCFHSANQLLVYQNGTYQNQTSQLGLPTFTDTRDIAWIDVDHDGWMDILMGHASQGWLLYRNNEGQGFTNITGQSGLPSSSSFHRFAMGDADLDGDLDLFMTKTSGSVEFHENMGGGHFINRTISSGLGACVGSGGCAWADFDNDKFPDIYTQGDGYHTIWHNNHDLTFTEMNVFGTGVVDHGFWWNPYLALADFDLDGDLDIYAGMCGTTNESYQENQLFQMDSLVGMDVWFTDLAPALGLDYGPHSNPSVFDFDADGDLDLIIRVRNEITALLRNETLGTSQFQVSVVGADDEIDCWYTRVEVYPHGSDQALMSAVTDFEGARRNGMNHYFTLDPTEAYDLRLFFGNGEVMLPEDYPELSGIVPASFGNIITVHRGVASLDPTDDVAPLPTRLMLEQNYPNPFNPTTEIRFSLPASQQVSLRIYDLLGRDLGSLIDGQTSAGSHAVTFDGAELAAGVYFYRLEAGDFSAVRKMILLK